MAASTEPKRGIYYGWVMAPFLILIPVLLYGIYFVGMGPSVTPLATAFGWSRTFTTGGFSTGSLVGAFAAPVLGTAIDRGGPRRIFLVGGLLFGLGTLLVSFDNGSGIFWYAGWILMVVLGPMWVGYPTLNKVASTWFLKRRGLVIGLITFSGAFCYFVTTVHVALIDSLGWRANWQIFGVVIIIAVLLTSFVIRNRPEQKGFRIDGAPMTPEERAEFVQHRGQSTPQAARARAAGEYSFTWAQAIRSPALWILSIVGGIATMALSIQTTQQVPFLEAMGVSRLVASAIIGIMGLMGSPFRIVAGGLMDRFGRGSGRFVYALAFVLECVGMVILLQARTVELVWVFAIIFGAGQGMTVTAPVAMLASYFGPEAYGTVYGIRMFLVQMGQVIGPLFAAYVFDTTGSYQTAFMVVVAALVVAVILLLLPWAAPPKVPIGAAAATR